MGNFLKNFGLGLIFMICSPILLCLVALGAVAGLLYFVFQTFNIIFRFFRGLKPFKQLEIDTRVEKIKQRLDLSLAMEQNAQHQPSERPVYVQQNYYQGPPPQGIGAQTNNQTLPPNQQTNGSIPMGPDIFSLPSEEVEEINFQEDDYEQ